jgi:glyoxylase-like metal-dependent hydrolase (beta-lactamase superfamily II)
LLLTHSHGDHAGGAAALRRYFGCRVVAGAADCEVVGDVAFIPQRTARGLPSWVLPAGIAGASVEVDVPLAGEREVVPGVIAVPVPGHTAGSYCYVDTVRGVAFVGDLVISYPDGLARSLRMIAKTTRSTASMGEFARRAGGGAQAQSAVLADFDGILHGLANNRVETLSPSGLVRRLRRLVWFAARYWRQGRA